MNICTCLCLCMCACVYVCNLKLNVFFKKEDILQLTLASMGADTSVLSCLYATDIPIPIGCEVTKQRISMGPGNCL